jgi:hypothetical protein
MNMYLGDNKNIMACMFRDKNLEPFVDVIYIG